MPFHKDPDQIPPGGPWKWVPFATGKAGGMWRKTVAEDPAGKMGAAVPWSDAIRVGGTDSSPSLLAAPAAPKAPEKAPAATPAPAVKQAPAAAPSTPAAAPAAAATSSTSSGGGAFVGVLVLVAFGVGVWAISKWGGKRQTGTPDNVRSLRFN